jgi:anthranilate/para-aminobenzoate synthase component I
MHVEYSALPCGYSEATIQQWLLQWFQHWTHSCVFECEDWRIYTWSSAEDTVLGKDITTLSELAKRHSPTTILQQNCPIPFATGHIALLGYDAPPIIAHCKSVLAYHKTTETWHWCGTKENKQTLLEQLDTIPRTDTMDISPSSNTKAQAELQILDSMTKEEYTMAVNKTKEAISMGDVYQINLSHYLSLPVHNPLDLWQRIQAENPSRHGVYWKSPTITIISNSPELFLHISPEREITSCPIKGTHAHPEDPQSYQHLWSSEKEESELTMIVDMMRNDLSLVCVPGSVVAENRKIRQCGDLLHAEQKVSGLLHSNISVWDAVASCFPPASITGAPKKSAMEHIAQLETSARGYYTGSFGFVDIRGNATWNVLIRSIFIENVDLPEKQGKLHVGAGIVYDSNAEHEWYETLAKAHKILNITLV